MKELDARNGNIFHLFSVEDVHLFSDGAINTRISCMKSDDFFFFIFFHHAGDFL